MEQQQCNTRKVHNRYHGKWAVHTRRVTYQGVHADVLEPASLYWPAGHSSPVMELVPGGQYLPIMPIQGPEHPGLDRPVPLPYLPLGHKVHDVARVVSEYRPGGQGAPAAAVAPMAA